MDPDCSYSSWINSIVKGVGEINLGDRRRDVDKSRAGRYKLVALTGVNGKWGMSCKDLNSEPQENSI